MSDMERKSAEIAKVILAPGYSHAENIFRLLARLEETMPHDQAIDLIHAKVVAEPRQY